MEISTIKALAVLKILKKNDTTAPRFGKGGSSRSLGGGREIFQISPKCVLGAAKLTLEEFLTAVIQIERISNLLPLFPLSMHIDVFQVLTPGHFLIGKSINSLPEPSLVDRKDNILKKSQKAQKFAQLTRK